MRWFYIATSSHSPHPTHFFFPPKGPSFHPAPFSSFVAFLWPSKEGWGGLDALHTQLDPDERGRCIDLTEGNIITITATHSPPSTSPGFAFAHSARPLIFDD